MDRRSWHLLLTALLAIGLQGITSNQLFPHDRTFVYDWSVKFNTGAMLPSKMVSEWHMNSKIIIQTSSTITQMQIVNVSGSHNITDTSLLNKPFRVNYTGGHISDVYIEPDDLPWSANMKRALASIFQVNLDLLKTKALVSSGREETIYGDCAIDYVIQASVEDKLSLHKTVNLQSCINLPINHWQNSPKYDCPSSFIDGSLALSERTMNFSLTDPVLIQNIVSSGVIEFQPFQAQAEVHHIYIKQRFTLENSDDQQKPATKIADVSNAIRTNILYEPLSDVDPIYGYKPSGDGILIEKVQSLLSEICDSLEWEIGIKGLDNETALQVLDLMWWLETSEWEVLYNNITLGTSYSQETIQHLFWDLLPQIGSNTSVVFIRDLVKSGRVKGFLAQRLVSTFPFYLRHPTEELLLQCEDFLRLGDNKEVDAETRNASILSFATLVYKTCSVKCSVDIVDKYTKIFLDRLTEATDYTNKMLYVHAISNMKLPKVLQFFAPQIANVSLSRHYRLLLLWATITAIDQNPEQAKEIFWPILLNKTESLELRALSTLVLLTSSPTTSRLSAIHSVMIKEESQQLYNFYYTTLQSLAKTMMPCYAKINKVVSYFVRFVPPRTHHWATGNYLLDYEDPVRGYGGLLQLLLLASEKTGLPNIVHFTAEQHSLGVTSSRSIYLKLEGINYKGLWDKFFGNGLPPVVKEPVLKEFIKQLNLHHLKQKQEHVHFEIFIKHDDHVIYCDYVNETMLDNIVSSIQKMSRVYLEFSVNYQSLQYPQRILTTQPTDIGTPALLTVTTSALLSARGSIQQKNDDDYAEKTLPRTLRNIELDVRYSINSITSLRTYNPLTNIWHGADRSRSLHARIPISTQLLLHYYRSYYKITSKRHKYFKAGSRLGLVWHSTTHVVPNGLPTAENHKTEDDWSVESRDLGARLGTLVFDCQDDARITDSLVIVKQAFQTHDKNYHMVLGGVPIVGLFSLMNYFTFLPPGGSCGVVFSLSPLEVEQTILVEGSTVSISMNQNNGTVWEMTSSMRRLKDGDKEISLKFRHSPKELNAVNSNNTWRLIRLEGSLLIPSRKSGILKPPNAVRSQALISWGLTGSPSSMEFVISPESKAQWPNDCSSNLPQCLQNTSQFATKQKATLQYSNLPQWLKMAVRSVFSDFVKTEGNSTMFQFSFPSKLPWTTRGMCAVNYKDLLTIDNTVVNTYDLKSDCYSILIADCSPLAQFVLGIKKNSIFKDLIDLKMMQGTTQLNNLTISANSSVVINGFSIELTDDYITYPISSKENDYIFKMKKWQETMIEIDMSNRGVIIQYYGHSVVAMVDGILKGSTCGLCGDFNGEISNELDISQIKCANI